jgi:hypothetical protein
MVSPIRSPAQRPGDGGDGGWDGGARNKGSYLEFQPPISNTTRLAMYDRVRRLKDTDSTLVAAATLILAGLVMIGIPPYILLGS